MAQWAAAAPNGVKDDWRGEFKTLQTFHSLIWVKDCKLLSHADGQTPPTRRFCIRHPALLPRGFHHSPRRLPGFLRQQLLWLLCCYLGDPNVRDNKSRFCFCFLAAYAGNCLVFFFLSCPLTTSSTTNAEVKNLPSFKLKSCLVAACAVWMRNYRVGLARVIGSERRKDGGGKNIIFQSFNIFHLYWTILNFTFKQMKRNTWGFDCYGQHFHHC